MRLVPSKTTSSVVMAVLFITTWVKPLWPIEQGLHTSLTLIAFVLLWLYDKKGRLSELEFFLIILFLCMHSLAAHWLYSNIPYDDWSKNYLGFSLNQAMGWTRNNFDRFVHLLYGFCFTPSIVRYVADKYSQSKRMAFVVAISAVMITSLWYEWFEWLVAISLSAEAAESYNGQQGDAWDAHKDMLMATLGSLVWWGRFYKRQP